MAYLGNSPAEKYISFERQVFTIVNSQTAYTLDHSVTNENDIRLVVNNIVQEPGSGKAYTASGTTLTLSAALTNGTDEMYCVFLGRAVGTVNPPAGSVDTAQLAGDAVTNAKIADDAVESENLNDNIISGQTELAVAPASTDELLISDGGTLKRVDVSLIGGTNTPTFFASLSGDQAYNDSTTTKIEFSNEVFDTGNVYDASTNYRFTPGFAGKSYIAAGAWSSDNQTSIYEQRLLLYKNGSDLMTVENEQSSSREWKSSYLNLHGVFSHNDTDYFEVYGYFNTNDGGSAIFPSGSGNNAIFRNFFYGYKIIE